MHATFAIDALRHRRLRRDADRILRAGVRLRSDSPLLRWRSAELTSRRERKGLARVLRGVVGELTGKTLPGAAPLNRVGLRPFASTFADLARRLGDLDQPVNARGVVLLQDLLTDGGGPLYVHERIDELPNRLREVLAALEVA